jgi:hypothetical protein
MSLRTFTENVINLAVENCLISDIPEILTPKKVDQMNEDKLRELASESQEVRLDREILINQSNILKKGLRTCQQYGPRELIG